MKLFSSLIAAGLILLALAFALANRQSVAVNLSPFGIQIQLPLYLLSLGTLLCGVLVGACIGWASSMPHRAQSRKLRKDIAGLREQIEDIQDSAAPQRRRDDRMLLPRAKKWRLWGRR